MYGRMGWSYKAEACLKDAETRWVTLVHDEPENMQYRVSLSDVYSTLGMLYNDNFHEPDKAEVVHLKELQIREKLVQEHPDVLLYVFLFGQAQNQLGLAAYTAGRLDVALTRLQKAKEWLERAANRGHVRAKEMLSSNGVLRAAVLARRGEYLKAIDEAEIVIRQGSKDFYNVCCVLSVASNAAGSDSKLSPPDRVRMAAQYADRAMEYLHLAIANGFRNAPLLKADKDLDPLRSRADFQKLVDELEPKRK
jgi:tetratricopeptide (TPR) repeat protein